MCTAIFTIREHKDENIAMLIKLLGDLYLLNAWIFISCVYYQSDAHHQGIIFHLVFLNVLFVHLHFVPVEEMQTKHLCAFDVFHECAFNTKMAPGIAY